ncbi:MAG: NifB/NifX family molybdenum-iron cluster-binding protein [Anaerolineales bacterium]|nr:NifB/NifX family molybdenum-iron cluster-binding protein [Anaerolineales bacterium]
MKIILTTTSPSIDSNLDSRFGRGVYFLVVDPDTLEWQAHPNPGAGAQGGAGTLAAQFVANQHAEAVISGDFGPNAYGALQAAGVAMYLFGASTTVREAIERFKAGQLERVGAPTGQGHPPRV